MPVAVEQVIVPPQLHIPTEVKAVVAQAALDWFWPPQEHPTPAVAVVAVEMEQLVTPLVPMVVVVL
jgi:hypothetical protein